MPFINSQDPGPPRVTVHICGTWKTMALRIYSNLKVQLHFHSLAPHLKLAQSYMSSRITRKHPAETHLTSNLTFLFFFPNQIFISHLQMPLIQQDSGRKAPGRTFWHEVVTVTIWNTENSLMLWFCCHYPREDIPRQYGWAPQITVI